MSRMSTFVIMVGKKELYIVKWGRGQASNEEIFGWYLANMDMARKGRSR